VEGLPTNLMEREKMSEETPMIDHVKNPNAHFARRALDRFESSHRVLLSWLRERGQKGIYWVAVRTRNGNSG
jgi:hypothetical protein